jgi:hypothetical protein
VRKVKFPYRTLDEAVTDAFKKIGGPEKAFTYLVKGFKTAAWRKRAERNAKAEEAAEKERIMNGEG